MTVFTHYNSNMTDINSLQPELWKSKVEYRSKNRMKVTFKLNQDQAAAYQRFKQETMPEGVTEDDFVRSIFFMGLATLEQRLVEAVKETVERQQVEEAAALEQEEAELEAEVNLQELENDIVESSSDK